MNDRHPAAAIPARTPRAQYELIAFTGLEPEVFWGDRAAHVDLVLCRWPQSAPYRSLHHLASTFDAPAQFALASNVDAMFKREGFDPRTTPGVVIEVGAGFNPPRVIRWPREAIVEANEAWELVRTNLSLAFRDSNVTRRRAIGLHGDANTIIERLSQPSNQGAPA